MSKITDYSFLFESMFGTKSTKGTSIIGSFQLSQLNSSSIQSQLKAAGIDTNSKQYKAAIKEMMQAGNGAMYTNIQCIKMFELTKKEFLQENGVHNGDTTRRRDVYDNLYRKTEKNDRLAAGYTMEQYERAYRNTFYAAVREADPKWELGKPIPSGVLDGITRESVERQLAKSGNKLVKRSSVSGSSIDLQI